MEKMHISPQDDTNQEILPAGASPDTDDMTDEITEEAPARRFSLAEMMAGAGDFLLQWGWLALLTCSIFLIGYYVLFPARGYFHSDTTDTLMWGMASAESNSLFNKDFDYACLLPFSTSLIMWPLVEIFGVTMLSHSIGMLIFFLCFTGGLILLLRKMGWSWAWTALGVSTELMLLSGSEKLREIFWGHTIYYSLGVLFVFVGLGLLFSFLDQNRTRTEAEPPQKRPTYKLTVTLLLIFIWFLLACTNQIIAIAIFALPVMAAWFCDHWFDGSHEITCAKNRRALLVFLLMGIGTVAGYLLTNLLADGIFAGYETSFSTYSPMSDWLDNAMKFPLHWVELLGVHVQGGAPLMSADSIRNLIMLIAAAVILILPTAALCCYRKIEDQKLRILILTYWFMVLLIMLGYICGLLSNAGWRLSPIMAMAVLVSVAFLRWSVQHVQMQRVVALMMIPVMTSGLFSAVTIARMAPDNYKNNILYMLSDFLKESDLHYGYATFWQANGLTVVSDSAVECRSVTITPTSLTPYNYQSCRSWYTKDQKQEEYFLLMTDMEKQDVEYARPDLAASKLREVEAYGYYIWVFDENIFPPEPEMITAPAQME